MENHDSHPEPQDLSFSKETSYISTNSINPVSIKADKGEGTKRMFVASITKAIVAPYLGFLTIGSIDDH